MDDTVTEQDKLPASESRCPMAIRIAGVIWIVLGCLILVPAALIVLEILGPGGTPAGKARAAGLLLLPTLTATLVAAGVVYVGVQATRGRLQKIRIYAGCSTCFGVLMLIGFALVLLARSRGGMPPQGVLVFIGIILAIGIVLLTAGVLVMVAHREYKA